MGVLNVWRTIAADAEDDPLLEQEVQGLIRQEGPVRDQGDGDPLGIEPWMVLDQ
jgi:hypothetical protein